MITRIPTKEELAYMSSLREKQMTDARKADPVAFDAYWKDLYSRLFPAK